MNRMRWVPWIVALGLLVPQALVSPALAADEEVSVEDGSSTASGTPAVSGESIPVSGSAAVSVAPAPQGAAKRSAGPVITRVTVMPVNGMTQVRIEGKGRLIPKVRRDAKECKIILDFPGATYTAPSIILGAPGLGDIVAVRGGQHQGYARVVIEVPTTVPVEEASEPGRCVFTFATKAEAGPEEAVGEAATAAGVASAEGAAAAPAPAAVAATTEPAAAGGRARVLHAMVEDLPDRTRLVVTADGVLRYKMASQNDGRELVLSLFDVDLKWSPSRLAVKEGPIEDVRAEETGTPSQMVRVSIKLREVRPYHIRRDQNQVVVEVDKAAEGEEAAAEVSGRGGDLMHKITLNVQNEDLPSLVKALAFEAGFENVVVNMRPGTYTPVTISLRDVPVAKALNLVLAPQNFVWKVERGVLRVATAPQFDLELEASSLSGGASADAGGGEDEGGISTRVFRMKYVSVFELNAPSNQPSAIQVANAAGMSSIVQTQLVDVITNMLLLKTRGRVIVDARSNSVIVTDASSNMARIARLIRDLDIPVPQVHILARLVQISRNTEDQIGINWTIEKSTPANPTLKGSALGLGAATGKEPFSLVTGFLGPGFNLAATLNMMQSRGDLQLIMNPSITTLHDRPAVVSSIGTQSYSQETTTIGAGGVPTTSKTWVSVPIPITLIVRPHVNPDKTVMLEVDITMTAVTGQSSGAPPDTTAQQATTRLLVRDRETGVIGGMLQDSKTKSVTKLPILGDLPWFLGGVLFRTETTTIKKVELVLFLTPTIAEEI